MMAFLVANAGILSVVGVGLALFLLGFFLAPYLTKNGKQKVVQGTDDVLQTLQTLVGHLNIGSMQGTAQTILNVAETVVHYVEQTMGEADNEAKKDTAVQTATTILGKIGVEVTDQEKQLLDVGIESAVSKMKGNSPAVNVTNPTTVTSYVPLAVPTTINSAMLNLDKAQG